jgi:hypothetical protein
MGNWTSITADDLKASGYGAIIDAARTSAVGSVDPVVEEIANAVARVQRAVAAGNALDQDTAKVPNSLKAVTVRMVVFALMERIRLNLTQDQRDTRRDDISDLKRIQDTQQRVETPDNPAGQAQMQSQPVPRISVPPRRFRNREEEGA